MWTLQLMALGALAATVLILTTLYLLDLWQQKRAIRELEEWLRRQSQVD